MARTRIAPSPTGNDIHIGNLYTALINWTIARKTGGQFVVRIEDTDRTRYVEGAEQKILQSLADYGLKNDEGPNVGGPYAPYRQSERLELYQRYARELVAKGKAYYSFATKEQLEEMKKNSQESTAHFKDGGVAAKIEFRKMLREPAIAAFTVEEGEKRHADLGDGAETTIRLLVPEDTNITFTDLIRGEITINTNQVDDQVLLKSDGFPTYHLAVVVDDVAMKISHIIRAEEWISSTPKHVLLYEAFGWEKPVFAHLPILRNPDKSKLSKRKNPVWAHWYLEQGYLPEAILNYLAMMGWSHPQQLEIFDLDEFVEKFELNQISPVGPAFDPKKLEWMNGMWMRRLSVDELADRLTAFYNGVYDREFLLKTLPLVQERIKILSEYEGYVEFFRHRPTTYEVDLAEHKDTLAKVKERLSGVSEWKAEAIGDAMVTLAGELGIKNGPFFQMLRVAITGKKISPPLNESMEILGKDEVLGRV